MSAYMSISSSPLIFIDRSFSGPLVLKSRSYAFSPSTLNSDDATSSPTVQMSEWPALAMASMSMSRPESTSHGGANPPSSPISVASPPNFFLMMLFSVW